MSLVIPQSQVCTTCNLFSDQVCETRLMLYLLYFLDLKHIHVDFSPSWELSQHYIHNFRSILQSLLEIYACLKLCSWHCSVDLWTWRLFLVPWTASLSLSYFSQPLAQELWMYTEFKFERRHNCTEFSFLICFYARVWKRLPDRDREELEENKEYDATYESVLFLCPRVSVEDFFFFLKRKASVCFLNKTLIRVSSSLCSTWHSPQN